MLESVNPALPSMGRCSPSFPLGDRSVYQIAPFGPTAVVVAHLLEAQQVFEHEPGMGTALADAAVSYGFPFRFHALGAVECDQFIIGLKRAVLIDRLGPWHAHRAGNMPSSLGGLGHAGRSDHFAGEFIRRTHVYQISAAFAVQNLEHGV